MKSKTPLKTVCIIIAMTMLLLSVSCSRSYPFENDSSVGQHETATYGYTGKDEKEVEEIYQRALDNYDSKKLIVEQKAQVDGISYAKKVNKDDYYSELVRSNPLPNTEMRKISDKGGIMTIGFYIGVVLNTKIYIAYNNLTSNENYKTILGINSVNQNALGIYSYNDENAAGELITTLLPIVPYINLTGPLKYDLKTLPNYFSEEAVTSAGFVYKARLNGVLCKWYAAKQRFGFTASTGVYIDSFDALYVNIDGEKSDLSEEYSGVQHSEDKKYYNYYFRAIDAIKEGKYSTALSNLQFVESDYKNCKDLYIALNDCVKAEKYLYAVEAFRNGEYARASSLISCFDNYLDSARIMDLSEQYSSAEHELKYKKAIELFNDNRYDDAKAAFLTLDGYKDSNLYIEKCDNLKKEQAYQEAVALYNKGDYEKAKTAFSNLNGYSDSKDYITKCDNGIKENAYQAAVALYNKGDYEKAKTAFTNLNGYSDSKAYIKKCDNAIIESKYQFALKLYNDGEYEEALKEFSKLGDYKDSELNIEKCNEKIRKPKYDYALELYNEAKNNERRYTDNYIEAQAIFKSLGDYKESKKYDEYCTTHLLFHIYKLKTGGVECDGFNADFDNRNDKLKPERISVASEVDGEKITSISGFDVPMYYNCKEIVIPESVTWLFGEYVFSEYCYAEKIYLPGSITKIDNRAIYGYKGTIYFDTNDISKIEISNVPIYQRPDIYCAGRVFYRDIDGSWIEYYGWSR